MLVSTACSHTTASDNNKMKSETFVKKKKSLGALEFFSPPIVLLWKKRTRQGHINTGEKIINNNQSIYWQSYVRY